MTTNSSAAESETSDSATSPPPSPAKSFAARTAKAIGLGQSNPDVVDFKQLYFRESCQLGDELDVDSITVWKGVGGEPWVAFTPRDRFGLALSGGGIRSATFNLGLAQALAHLGILKEVDYLSTVSGGGYVGGFWMAWLRRKGKKTGLERFPLGNDRRGGERAEVRHLREFSRFLLPRIGLLQTEFWGIAMTVLGGLLPSLLAAIALLFLYWSVWVSITGVVLLAHPFGAICLGIALLGYLLISEWLWTKASKSEYNGPALAGYFLGSLSGACLVIAAAWFWREIFLALPKAVQDFIEPIPRAYAPALLLGAGTLILLLGRVVLARFFHRPTFVSVLEGFERTLTRFLGLTASLVAFGVLWWAAGLIADSTGRFPVSATAAGAAGSAALFAWAKKWLTSPVQETHGSNLILTVIKHLKRATPKLLASLTWLLLFLLVGAAIRALTISPERSIFPHHPYGWVLGASVLIIILTALLFDPARVGMHEFYRSRISRCYLGASNLVGKGSQYDRAAENRYVIERPNDDLTLKDLRDVPKPLHLICTAANDISGDSLGTLYRGARSAVLSGNGITLGDETAKLDNLRLSAALTASAAAFNSHMGRVSMDLGPAVTFLMSALNLRLGLWVPHPQNRRRGSYAFPGRLFLCELLGLSNTSSKNLHLSDGNHFENFGLYELIRRHVRYILVSDCGADPEVAFDDLANVLRRVREDFGVEIDLDIRALRPGDNGLARQHAVVGTVHYNGLTGMDKGTIVFLKPTLTGDEPPDVLQYRTRNRAFPHESTGDQFYDEPQWESYRRLGEHAIRMVFGFFDRPDMKVTNKVDKLFRDARSAWQTAPDLQNEGFLNLTERCARLEADLLAHGPPHLRGEIYAEVSELAGTDLSRSPGPDEEMAIFSYLMRVMQIMEDVWLSADLDHYWSHPLNEGWMSYFHRWSSTASFRRWWPVLTPLYSLGFREFIKDRFGVGVQDRTARPDGERSISTGQLTLKKEDDAGKFKASPIWQSFQQRHSDFELPANAALFRYELALLGYDGTAGGKPLPVGLGIIQEEPFKANGSTSAQDPSKTLLTAVWRSGDLYVPQALHGSGILARLLDAIIKHYETSNTGGSPRRFVQLEVRFAPDQIAAAGEKTHSKPKILSQAAREQRVQDIDFYKSRGFQYVKAENPMTGEITLTLPLAGITRA
jgi:hypothetical protein